MLNKCLSTSLYQRKPDSFVNDLNDDSLSSQPESLEKISSTQSLRLKIQKFINQEKEESKPKCSEKLNEEKKEVSIGDCILMREIVPLFCSIESGKPSDHPDQGSISIYLNNEFLEKTTTITYCWLPILSLKKEGKFNSNFQKNVDVLKFSFAAWRKVRGDGNCYYRSVMSGYLLKIFHPSSAVNYSTEFMDQLLKFKSYSQPLEELFNILSPLYFEFYSHRDSSVYLKIEKLLQDPQFDLWLIETSRFLSESAIEDCTEIKDFTTNSEEEIQLKVNLKTMGNEAEGVELFLLPKALGITVQQVNFFENTLYSTFPNENSTRLTVYIISKSKGHYDMLLSVKDMEVQQYSVNELIFYHN